MFNLFHIIKKTIFGIIIIFLTGPGLLLWGLEKNLRFDRISIDDGLSQSCVFAIIQDHHGFMWFGTEDGLNRYDGYEFKIFRHDPEDAETLSNNHIWCIFEDNGGILWIGTEGGGLNKFDQSTGTIKRYEIESGGGRFSQNDIRVIYDNPPDCLWIGTEGNGLIRFNKKKEIFEPYNPKFEKSGWNIRAICEDQAGVLWVGTYGNGLKRIAPGSDAVKSFENPDNKLRNSKITVVYEDNSGILWVGSHGDGLQRFDRKKEKFLPYKTTDNDSQKVSDNINCIFRDRDDVLWFGTEDDGVCYLDVKTGQINCPNVKASSPYDLSHYDIRCIFKDRSGILWMGTYGGGLNKFDPNKQEFALYNSYNSNLSNNDVMAIYEDHNNVLWIGTYNGGLNKLAPNENKFRHFKKKKDGLSSNSVRVIFQDRNRALWIGTNNGGLNKLDPEKETFTHYKQGQGLSDNSILCIKEDKEGVLWIGTRTGGLNRFDRKTSFTVYKHEDKNPLSLSHNEIRAIYQTQDGVIWIGTDGGGLSKMTNRETGTFKNYMHNPNNPKSISNNDVLCIFEDQSLYRWLWIGTSGGGLNRFDRENEVFKSYQGNNTLDNIIYGILEDGKGNLWLSTNKGLSRFNPRTEHFRKYDKYDGLQSDEFNYGAYFKDKEGKMYFGGINGFNVFLPGNIKDDLTVPDVQMTNFLLDNKKQELQAKDKHSPLKKPIHEMDRVELSYKQDKISFEFSALHYSCPRKNKYKYRLNGYDREWIDTGWKNRRATYTGLPSGNYVFHVKGSNKDGIWNEIGRSIKVKIYPSPWQTWWAYTLYMIIGVGVWIVLLIIGFKFYWDRMAIQQLKKNDGIRKKFLSTTTHELRAPLTGIIGLADSLIKGGSETLSPKLAADLLTISLNGKRLLFLINDLLDAYKIEGGCLKIQKTRLDLYAVTNTVLALCQSLLDRKKLVLVNNIARGTPLIEADKDRLFQVMYNLVGNAVKFTKAGEVRISAQVIEGMVEVSVADTGPGIPEEKFEEIFEPFKQVGDTGAPFFSGTGLGLPITRQLVQLQGGKLWVESTVGKGSTFIFTIPLSAKKTAEPTGSIPPKLMIPSIDMQGDEIAPTDQCGIGARHILVVDDDPISRRIIYNYLTPFNYMISEASSGFEALNMLEKGYSFDLILLDITMPGMDGYGVCKSIRRKSNAAELPVLFLTSRLEEEALTEAFNTGGNDYLTKPVTMNELLSRVKTHIQLKDTLKQLARAEKMAGLAAMTAVLGHQLSTPASAIIMNSNYFIKVWQEILPVLEQYANTQTDFHITRIPFAEVIVEIKKMLEGLEQSSMEINNTINEMNEIAFEERASGKKNIDINIVVRAAIKTTRELLANATSHFQCKLGENLPFVHGNWSKLHQVVVNLIRNSCQALTNANLGISISTHLAPQNKQVVIEVKDEGVGIKKSDMEYIFDPFFSTGDSIGKMGLGLFVSQLFVREHEGQIDVQSKPGQGTTVTVYIPHNSSNKTGNHKEVLHD